MFKRTSVDRELPVYTFDRDHGEGGLKEKKNSEGALTTAGSCDFKTLCCRPWRSL